MNPKENTLLFEIADKMDAFQIAITRLEADRKNDKEEIKVLKQLVAILQSRQAKMEAYLKAGDG